MWFASKSHLNKLLGIKLLFSIGSRKNNGFMKFAISIYFQSNLDIRNASVDDRRRIMEAKKRSMWEAGWWGNGGYTRSFPEILPFMNYLFHKRSYKKVFNSGKIQRTLQRLG